MQLKDFARRLPEEVWELFEPLLPARIWCGNGRPPKSNRDCFQALLYVLVTGIPWELLHIRAALDTATYRTGHEVTDEELGKRKRNLTPDTFHDEWNYTIPQFVQVSYGQRLRR